MSHDLVIRNGTLIDGTGAEPIDGDVAIDGDKITAIGEVTVCIPDGAEPADTRIFRPPYLKGCSQYPFSPHRFAGVLWGLSHNVYLCQRKRWKIS